jgi:hypothetical protein
MFPSFFLSSSLFSAARRHLKLKQTPYYRSAPIPRFWQGQG